MLLLQVLLLRLWLAAAVKLQHTMGRSGRCCALHSLSPLLRWATHAVAMGIVHAAAVGFSACHDVGVNCGPSSVSGA